MKKILIMGFCFPDSQTLYTELKLLFSAEVISLQSLEELIVYLKSNPAPNLIIINRILHANKQSGLEILEHLKQNNQCIPIAILTATHTDQKKLIAQGATLSFDLDLLISFLGPKRKIAREKVVKEIDLIINQV